MKLSNILNGDITMKTKPRSYFYMVLSFFILFGQLLIAGTTGKIAGKVIDVETGDPLPGVNVLLEGTFLGASADTDGQFFIINIPPGIYTVQALHIGYSTKIIKNVQISADRTTKIDFLLEQTVLEQTDAIVIVADNPIIQKDQTGSMATVGAKDIAAMPVQSINEVLNLQAGVIQSNGDFHVRGGRSGETQFMVDGVSITNLSGERGIQVETDAVQEMQLISGTFNAEYGNAMSGIVNIVTKEGGKNYSGQVQASAGSFWSGGNTYSVMTNSAPGTDPETGKTVIIDQSDKPLTSIRPQYDVRGFLSGPVPFIKNKLNFFINGSYKTNNGHIYGRRWFTPQGLAGDSALVPLRSSISTSFQGKITYRPFSALKIEYSTFYNYSNVDHNTSTIYRYLPESGRQQLKTGISQILSFNHALSSNTFYDLKISNYFSEYESYLYDDPSLTPGYFIRIHKTIAGQEIIEDIYYSSEAEKNAIIANAKENSWSYEFVIDPSRSKGYINPNLNVAPSSFSFRDTYTPLDYNYNKDKFWLAKFDLTSQVSNNHLLKFGIETIFHEMKRKGYTLRPKTDVDDKEIVPFEPAIEPASSIWHNDFTRNPIDISAYLQDKMEFDQLIVNIGLRLDYFDPDYIIPVDPADPDIFNPFNPEWKGPDWDEAHYTSLTTDEKGAYTAANSYTPDERRKFMQNEVDPKIQLSPRIGIAYPISEKGVIHISYGHFFQMPEAGYLFGNAGNVRPDYKLSVGSDQNLFGNADLKAESTVQYEIGLQAEISKGLGLDLTLFYKDIRDWVGISPMINTNHSQTTKYVQYENKDYANVRGITLAFEARPTNNFTAMLDYTYQVAEGTYSSPNDAYSSLISNEEPAKKLIFMDYDRRHSINGILTYRLKGWVGSIIGKFNTGFPYTPAKVAGTPQANYRGWRENIARRPSNSQVDLRVDKVLFETEFISHRMFFRVYNLFDQRGELRVHPDTGTAKYTSYGTHNWVPYNSNRVGSLEHFYLNPDWYQPPREIQVGYILNF